MPQESSASRVAGLTYRVFEHEGKKYLLSRSLLVSSYQEEEAFVLSRRRDPGLFGLRMLNLVPTGAQAALWEGCARADMAGIPSPDEWLSYRASNWKLAFMFWHTLDEKHKVDENNNPINLVDGVKWAVDLLTTMPQRKIDELNILIGIVSQDSALKNLSGRTAQKGPAASQQTDVHSSTDGQQSTNTLPTDSDIDPTK